MQKPKHQTYKTMRMVRKSNNIKNVIPTLYKPFKY